MPIDDKKKLRLHTSLDWSRVQMQDFRRHRMNAIKQFLGKRYSDNGAPKDVPLNLIEQTINIFARQLVARNPKSKILVTSQELKPFASKFKLAIDHLVDEIKLEESLTEVVVDALFLVGFMRTGINSSDRYEVRGVTHDTGQPYADAVAFDNFIVDMTASRWEDAQYMGDRFKIPLDMAQDLYPEHADQLIATSGHRTDNDGAESVDNLSGSRRPDTDAEFEPRIELTHLYLPRTNEVLVMSEHVKSLPVLDQKQWEGVETGPYNRLEFSRVPQNLLPLSPIANLMEIHESVNSIMRKMLRQAERQKTILAVSSSSTGDAEKTSTSNDGDVVAFENPSGSAELSMGGIDNKNFAFMVHMQQLFSRQAGNLDTLGGLSPQADTLGQEQLLASGSSQKVSSMEYKVNLHVQGVLKSLGFFLYNDPLIELPLTKRRAGIEIPVNFSSLTMEGDFFDYNIKVEPLSMRPRSSQQQLSAFMQVLQNVIYPGLPFLEQQGLEFDFEEAIKQIAELGDIPELLEVIKDSTGEFLGGGVNQVSDRPLQSPVTTRINERVNRPGSTQKGSEDAMIQTLMGAGQSDSVAAIDRPVS